MLNIGWPAAVRSLSSERSGVLSVLVPEDPDLMVFGAVFLVVVSVALAFELRSQRRKKLERRRRARNLFEARQRQRLRNEKKNARSK